MKRFYLAPVVSVLCLLLATPSAATPFSFDEIVAIGYEFTTDPAFGTTFNVRGVLGYTLPQPDLNSDPNDDATGIYELTTHIATVNGTPAITQADPGGQFLNFVSVGNDIGGSGGVDAFRIDSSFNTSLGTLGVLTAINLSFLGPTSLIDSDSLFVPDLSLFTDQTASIRIASNDGSGPRDFFAFGFDRVVLRSVKVAEPGTLWLLGIGLLGMVLTRRKL